MARHAVDVREYPLIGGGTAYAVSYGTRTILVTPPCRISSPTHWEVWRLRSAHSATLARAVNATEGIENARAILTR